MTFKPMTYLVSFTLFVLLFMGLGGYVGYHKIADHFLTQAFLDATPLQVHVQADPAGPLLRWEERVALERGESASILATSRSQPISIRYAEAAASPQAPAQEYGIPLAAKERTEDLRVDRAGRYLYARVFAASSLKAEETTWLCKYDLRGRRLLRRIAVNPILLPPPFRP
jgi:hypothetical protein